jgi:hypothetical protein
VKKGPNLQNIPIREEGKRIRRLFHTLTPGIIGDHTAYRETEKRFIEYARGAEMELAKRREIEIKSDEMRKYGNESVQAWLNQTNAAMKNRQWDEVERCFGKAQEDYDPPVFLEQELLRLNAASSMAHAKRLVANNKVFVDGRRAKLGANIQGWQSIKADDKVFKAKIA